MKKTFKVLKDIGTVILGVLILLAFVVTVISGMIDPDRWINMLKLF